MNNPIPLILRGALCALAFSSYHLQAAPTDADDSAVRLDIELQDDSRLVGKSPDDMLTFHSTVMGDMKLPWTGIRSIENPRGANTLQLMEFNGDLIAVQFPANVLHLETEFGPTDLPVKLIRSVKVTIPPRRKPAPGSASANQTGWRLSIELRDGAHVIANGLADTMTFHSFAMGDLKLTWDGIRSIEYAETNTDTARLTVTNGDIYEVQFAVPSLGLETSFGKTELPVKLIRSVKAVPLAAWANEIPFINGSFELIKNHAPLAANTSTSITPGETWLTGWTVAGPGGPSVAVQNGTISGLAPYEGRQWLVFNQGNSAPGGSVSQTFNTEMGVCYKVSFAVELIGSGNVSITASALASDKAVIASKLCVPTVSQTWTLFDFNFTATSPETTLIFLDSSPSPAQMVDIALDGVTVTDCETDFSQLKLDKN